MLANQSIKEMGISEGFQRIFILISKNSKCKRISKKPRNV